MHKDEQGLTQTKMKPLVIAMARIYGTEINRYLFPYASERNHQPLQQQPHGSTNIESPKTTNQSASLFSTNTNAMTQRRNHRLEGGMPNLGGPNDTKPSFQPKQHCYPRGIENLCFYHSGDGYSNQKATTTPGYYLSIHSQNVPAW